MKVSVVRRSMKRIGSDDARCPLCDRQWSHCECSWDKVGAYAAYCLAKAGDAARMRDRQAGKDKRLMARRAECHLKRDVRPVSSVVDGTPTWCEVLPTGEPTEDLGYEVLPTGELQVVGSTPTHLSDYETIDARYGAMVDAEEEGKLKDWRKWIEPTKSSSFAEGRLIITPKKCVA